MDEGRCWLGHSPEECTPDKHDVRAWPARSFTAYFWAMVTENWTLPERLALRRQTASGML